MAQRSRKRGRRAKPGATVMTATVATPTTQTSRPGAAEVPESRPRQPTGRRSEARNEAVRATLVPLAPGERPWPATVSALIALGLAVANLVLLLINVKVKIGSGHASVSSQIAYIFVMSVCAYGLWRTRYWGVLLFMVILLLAVLVGTLFLVRANNALGYVVSIVLIGGGGFLFYKLVRVMSRIQTPARPDGS